MDRYAALIRDTWWMWIILLLFGVVLGFCFSRIFFIAIPICFFAFIYFGLMRYDADGNPFGDGKE